MYSEQDGQLGHSNEVQAHNAVPPLQSWWFPQPTQKHPAFYGSSKLTEKWVQMLIFWPTRKEITEECGKRHNEELYQRTEVIKDVLLKNQGFWDVTLRPWTSSSGRFERSQYPHIRYQQSMKSGYNIGYSSCCRTSRKNTLIVCNQSLPSCLMPVSNDRLELNKWNLVRKQILTHLHKNYNILCKSAIADVTTIRNFSRLHCLL
jgi:hypothetical protein